MATASTSTFAPMPTPTLASIPSPPPIAKILPYLSIASSFLLASITKVWRVTLAITTYLTQHLITVSPVPILAYVLAPITVFCEVAFGFFVLTPYRTTVYLLEAMYPVYVFCGVACITGGLLGLAGRSLSQILMAFALPEEVMEVFKVEVEVERE
ncbi:hypothetical protein BDQ12DRAFT_448712 [Crucibulum laeve]|uniref:Uncharacterized protein n=1 Tax=Crucibulum laeve TaxID=68775 RepID=A0A5C3LKL0_9AGAR|nr:hypothetical protein BDQ12DRAFT_448712 [Crucibulum laeve]